MSNFNEEDEEDEEFVAQAILDPNLYDNSTFWNLIYASHNKRLVGIIENAGRMMPAQAWLPYLKNDYYIMCVHTPLIYCNPDYLLDYLVAHNNNATATEIINIVKASALPGVDTNHLDELLRFIAGREKHNSAPPTKLPNNPPDDGGGDFSPPGDDGGNGGPPASPPYYFIGHQNFPGAGSFNQPCGCIDMRMLSGFMMALGVIAVATAFIVLNASSGGALGITVAVAGVVVGLVGLGLFNTASNTTTANPPPSANQPPSI